MNRFAQKVPSHYLGILCSYIEAHEPVLDEHKALVKRLVSKAASLDGLLHTGEFLRAQLALIKELKDPALGVKYGQHLSLADHGPLGALTSVCSNNLEFLEAHREFLEIRMPTKLSISKLNKHYEIRLIHTPEFSDMLEFHNQVFVAHLIATLEAECGYSCTDAIIGFPHSSTVRYENYFEQQVKLKQRYCYIRIPDYYAKLPFIHADPISKKLFEKICAEMKEKLKLGNTIKNSILTLFDRCDGYPNFSHVAPLFHMTTRTLSNKLAKENTNYREIVLLHRMDSAKKMLTTSNISIENISEKIGYSNIGNFCRAFKNYTGLSPSSYREDHQEEP